MCKKNFGVLLLVTCSAVFIDASAALLTCPNLNGATGFKPLNGAEYCQFKDEAGNTWINYIDDSNCSKTLKKTHTFVKVTGSSISSQTSLGFAECQYDDISSLRKIPVSKTFFCIKNSKGRWNYTKDYFEYNISYKCKDGLENCDFQFATDPDDCSKS